MIKYYRILVEVDGHGETIESVAVSKADTDEIIEWFSNTDEAFEWVRENGELAVEQ